jgi:hypothetical protein
MENKQLKEQIAFDYRERKSSRSASEHEMTGRRGTRVTGRSRREEQPSAHTNANTRRRVVTMPKEIVQPTPWADRPAHKHRAHTDLSAGHRLVKRTLAQTGIPAPGGQVRLIRPLPGQDLTQQQQQVPMRSGQRNARRGRFWRRFLSLFALLVICIAGASFALTSSNFRVQQVEVVGTQNGTLVHTIQNMSIQGQNIFLLDVGAMTTRIEALPVVASANLVRQLPDQVTVNVVERTPVLLWQTQQGIFSIDSHGVVIATANGFTGTDGLMTVVDERDGAAQQIQPGALLNEADIAFAREVFARLPQLSGVPSFTLRYDTIPKQGRHGSFIVVSSDGWLAYLGSADDTNPLDNRLVELQQILSLAQQEQLKLATIDLRFGLRPVYTLKS